MVIDYHTLQDQGIHLAVKVLLDHLPDNLSLGIATRADPPLSLSRLRARRQMVELRSNDLRFVVTIGTVKAHTSNIYRKLDVPGRTKALAKARELHLL